MTAAGDTPLYPRGLTPREREWIEWILPASRSGYAAYRNRIAGTVVIGEGRRGTGELILGRRGDEPDFSAPLAPVFAYGMIESDTGGVSVTIRQESGGQISVEIAAHAGESVPDELPVRRRWSYSDWLPGGVCPQCRGPLREVPMRPANSPETEFTLALCPVDGRIWLYERASGINHLIPVTNYYNELMLKKNIRDPIVALSSARLFTDIGGYSDADLTAAFESYNRQRHKVRIDGPLVPAAGPAGSPLSSIFRIFRTP
ncbi:MAG TPA: hypothetical protein VMW43_10470 [Bacteroidota bacterium]|nr:hypothetical protein [Bacteroidota bacterium]